MIKDFLTESSYDVSKTILIIAQLKLGLIIILNFYYIYTYGATFRTIEWLTVLLLVFTASYIYKYLKDTMVELISSYFKQTTRNADTPVVNIMFNKMIVNASRLSTNLLSLLIVLNFQILLIITY